MPRGPRRLSRPSRPRIDGRDYFVRAAGQRSKDSGFHRLLADFMGWELPIVPAFNNKEVPLYLEILFPFLAIEQKAGWSGILPRIPTYLQVRDPLQRGVEFFLGRSWCSGRETCSA